VVTWGLQRGGNAVVSAFQRVRNTLAQNAEATLQRLGVKLKQRGGEWLSVMCPLCTDKSGSCSIARDSLFLKCHQCQEKLELFTWVMRAQNLSTVWDACKHLAALWNMKLVDGRRTNRPRAMNDKLLAQTMHDLWDDDNAESLRQFLVDRALGDPLALEPFQIGFLNDKLTFPQRGEHGDLLDRYRLYSPGRWAWSRGKGASRALWPTWLPPKEGEDVWLLEGEWDVLVARIHLELHAYCWTSPMAPLTPGLLPSWLKKRRVRVCYDNDTFQPLGEDVYAPNSEKRREFDKRRNNLLHGIAEALVQFGNEVHLHAIPINPVDQWGADFRDWYEAGGRNPDTIPSWPLEEILKERPKAKEVSFDDVFVQPFQARARFRTQFNAMEIAGMVIPKVTEIECPMGEFSFCEQCAVPDQFPGQIIDWERREEDLAHVLNARDAEREILSRVLQRPTRCNRVKIHHVEHDTGYRWIASREEVTHGALLTVKEAIDDTKVLTVVSKERPSVSSPTVVTGVVHMLKHTPMVMADRTRAIDDASSVNLKDFAYRLEELCPWATNKTTRLDDYFCRRAGDLASNVTGINERQDVHFAVDLAYHSVMHIPFRKRVHRGFLDISIIGETRTGKSEVVRWLRDHYDAGSFLIAGENITRVGLTAGVDKDGRIRPGLFPRNHGKLLALDEFHKKGRDGNVIGALQGPRDIGILDIAKISGGSYPAGVRFILIGNTVRPVDGYTHLCEHFLDIYDSPECLSRMDFGVFVRGEVETEPVSREHEWTGELAHALIMRAWRMEPADIRILPDAEALIRSYVTDWRDQFSEELPLYTSGEKACSLRRIAVSVANWSFSHPVGELGMCEVRTCHVDWAARWLLHCWESVDYPRFSYDTKHRFEEVQNAYVAELLLTVNLGLSDHEYCLNTLGSLFGEFDRRHVQPLTQTGDYREADRWIGSMVRAGAIVQVGSLLKLTKGAIKLVRQILWLAGEHNEEYVARYKRLKEWELQGKTASVSLVPLEEHISKLRETGSVYGSSSTNIIPIDHGG